MSDISIVSVPIFSSEVFEGFTWVSSSGTGIWSCVCVSGGAICSLSSSMGSGDCPLGETMPPSLESVALEFWLRVRLDEALGQVKTKGVSRTGVLSGSSRLDLGPIKASE